MGVDNEGVVNLVDASKAAGVKRFVLVSSILTNGRAVGQADSPGFQVTNAFGGVLDEKLMGEKHLEKSGLDYAIVRPGGLKNGKPGADLVKVGADLMYSGEISRELVARVMVAAAFVDKATLSKQRIVEIAEEDTFVKGYVPEHNSTI